MKVGIIGAGAWAAGWARRGAQAGDDVMFSFSRDPQRLEQLADELGTLVDCTNALAPDIASLMIGHTTSASEEVQVGPRRRPARLRPGARSEHRDQAAALGDLMIVEYIRYRMPAERRGEFEGAYATAQTALRHSPHCLAYEVAQCVEEPSSYVVRIEWDSVEGHVDGFRKSAVFAEFFAAVRPFLDDIEEMRHYELTAIASGHANQPGRPAE
jgi:quinol monooxygenase YgiN